jgi:thiosulfate dehydrogenase [quinone] large subunit
MRERVSSDMETRTLETEILGREVNFDYSEHWVGYSILAMRVGIGWIMLQGGLQKLLNPSWTAAGYLNNVPAGNPLTSLWASMAGVPLVDQLVIAGLTLTGIGLIFGAFFRASALSAAAMNALFWASSLEGGIMQGLPVAHGWVVDSHIVYIALLLGLGAIGAGRIVGVDEELEKLSFVEKRPWLKYLLG